MGWILGVLLLVVALGCGLGARRRWDPHLRRTAAGPALIHNAYEFGERPVRVLAVRGGWQSGMRLADPNELVFPYVRAFDALFEGRGEVRRVLCIGGGGFSYPRSLAARGVRVDAVECDPKVVAIARDFFHLAEAEALADADGQPLLSVIVADGMAHLRATDASYDAVVIDAYDGMAAAPAFSSPEAIALVERRLSPDGVVAVNVVTPREDPAALVAWVNRLKGAFAHVLVLSCTPGPAYVSRNHVVLASDGPLSIEGDRFGPFGLTRF